jgi:hypothetical protein
VWIALSNPPKIEPEFFRFLISVLSIVPPEKRPKLDYQALAVSDDYG